jgi:DNA-binding IclR family transcriptional regulator
VSLTLQQLLVLDAIERGVDRVTLISQHVGIPIPSVWTRLHELTRLGLVRSERTPIIRTGWKLPRGRPQKHYMRVEKTA